MHTALFLRLDKFIERTQELSNVIETLVNYKSMKDIIVGGTKGEKFTSDVQFIFNKFKVIMHNFTDVEYDVMDVDPETTKKFYKD